jgi:hypothetical protein
MLKRFNNLTVSEGDDDKRFKISHLRRLFKIEKRIKYLPLWADIVVVYKGGGLLYKLLNIF